MVGFVDFYQTLHVLSLTGGQVDVEAPETLFEAVAGEQLAVDGVVLALQVVDLEKVVADHSMDLPMDFLHYTELCRKRYHFTELHQQGPQLGAIFSVPLFYSTMYRSDV